MSFEAALSHARGPRLDVFARLRHRSGIDGVISPQRAGSNFIGGGLRWRFG